MFDRLDPSCQDLMRVTSDHLGVSLSSSMSKTLTLGEMLKFLLFFEQELAADGLRTLALAYKDLDEEEFGVWMQKLHFASTVIEGREAQLAVTYEEIERGLKVKSTPGSPSWLQPPQTVAPLQASGRHGDRGQTSGRSPRNHRQPPSR